MVNAADLATTKYIKLGVNQTLSQALGKLKNSGQRIAVIAAGNTLKGYLDKRDLLVSRLHTNTTKLSTIMTPIPSVNPTSSIIDVAEIMYASYPSVIKVKGKGIITAEALMAKIDKFPEIAHLKVKDAMTREVFTMKKSDRVGHAISLMREDLISRIPITNKLGFPVSIITVSDLLKTLTFPRQKIKGSTIGKGTRTGINTPQSTVLMDTNINDLASSNVVTVTEDHTLHDAIKLMKKNRISDVVVTKRKKVVGIVTVRDLLKAFLRLKKPEYWGIAIYGSDKLKPFQEKGLRTQMNTAYEKISRVYFKKIVYFLVHVKPYEEGFAGKARRKGRTKWVIRARLALPDRVYVTHGQSFNLSTAASHALKKLEMNVQESIQDRRKVRKPHEGKKSRGRRADYEKYISEQLGLNRRGFKRAFAKLIKR